MRDSVKTATLWSALFVAILGSSFGFAYWLSMPAPTPKYSLDPSNPDHKKMLCGPISLLKALGRVGIGSSLKELASQCEVDSKGVTLRNLERVTNGIQEVKSRVRRLDWDDLTSLDGTAVLFVRGHHYVAVDPREADPGRSTNEAAVRVYDEGKPARWMTREELEEIWRGETLVIRRRTPSLRQAAGPSIEWDRCLIDKGVLKPDAVVEYVFPFRNVGSSDLTIDRVAKSCGCATYSITSRRLAPGQAGVIKADVDLRGKRGYFQNHIFVKTNDATKPLSILRMTAGVLRARVLSAERISLGDLPRGGGFRIQRRKNRGPPMRAAPEAKVSARCYCRYASSTPTSTPLLTSKVCQMPTKVWPRLYGQSPSATAARFSFSITLCV